MDSYAWLPHISHAQALDVWILRNQSYVYGMQMCGLMCGWYLGRSGRTLLEPLFPRIFVDDRRSDKRQKKGDCRSKVVVFDYNLCGQKHIPRSAFSCFPLSFPLCFPWPASRPLPVGVMLERSAPLCVVSVCLLALSPARQEKQASTPRRSQAEWD